MKRLLATTVLFGGLAFTGHANADEILSFTQNGTTSSTVIRGEIRSCPSTWNS